MANALQLLRRGTEPSPTPAGGSEKPSTRRSGKASPRPVATPPAPLPPRSPHWRRKMQRQAWAAAAIGGVALSLTALSLSHLAHGIALVTRSESWEPWAMGAGIDLGFISLEMAMVLAATATVRERIARFASPAIVVTLAASAALNAFAFNGEALSWATPAAVALGFAIPAMIYALTRIGAAMWLDCDR